MPNTKKFFLKISMLLFFLAVSLPSWGKVEPYNYNFSLEILDDFWPEKSEQSIEAKYKKGVLISKKEDYRIVKYVVNHQRYTFPILVQYFKEKSVDFYIRLPSYFIHDIFHESLVKKLGKQDTYSKYEESASYSWKNAKECKHYYRAECTITCFPIFYSVVSNKSDLPSYQPIIKQMLNESSWK
jgi:hypothetical protein